MRKTLVIYKAHAYARLTGFKPELVKEVLIPFCKQNFYRFQKVPGETFGTTKWEVSHVFARFNSDKTELRFNASMIENLVNYMTARGYNKSRIVIEEEPEIVPVKKNHELLQAGIGPRNELQEEFVKFMVESLGLVTNNMGTGQGKLASLSGKVKIPGGWTTMGEIKKGDIVTAWDGTPTEVLEIYPQGVKDIYEFTFSDGRKAEAGLEHLWKVFDCSKRPHLRDEVITTEEIIRRLGKAQPRLYIPLLKPEVTPDVELPLDPWVYGAMLGDGCMVQNRCTFTNDDPFVVNKLRERVGDTHKVMPLPNKKRYEFFLTPKFHDGISFGKLLSLSMIDRATACDKKIDERYMNASQEQKWELIRGLMDTDGSAEVARKGDSGCPTFNTSSETLAKQMQELIWSLGGWCKITSRIPTYTYKGEKKEGQRAYRCYIRINDPKRCFSLPRKKDLVPEESQYSENLKLRIMDVKLVRKEEAQCISIAHPDRLYVCDDYVVTHNTFCALYSSFLIGERILITALPRYVDIWVKAFGEFYKIAANEIMLADTCNVQDVHQAILKGADPKIIIIPLTKIDIYLKKMKEEPETTVNLDQVFNDLGCGVRIIDEAHESIYSVYQSLLYGNHKKTMILSATLKGDDEFINGIYNQIFPQKSYLRATEYTQYINVISYHFRMDMWKYKINTKGFGGYSHVKFEQGILKKPYVMEEYFKMLMGAYREYFTDHYREGMKSMWFFATTEMCEKFNEYFISQNPGADSIVFTAAISKKQPTAYREHDNVVTTPGSCGTGKDIPYLFTVFSPVSVSSSQRNDQMVGRTRPVDKWWSDLFPYFVYFTCRDEPKQLDYDKKRRGLFGRKAKKIDVIDSGFRI
ncbi:putative DNA helicase/terminase [Aeromonas phage D6]|uniref:DNA helicase/terminase n=1 Tax=Aeromonas phage D6 TaxID=2593322 RepID=A0A514TW18_9CAUD|nr:DarB-like antirestriction [Aeromonas phage D6]QDJ97225.1 putative DNA helicase/terminase [Aeromonas phage D6]